MSDQARVTQIKRALSQYKRGYRSNKYLDAIRPQIHKKQRWCLSMEDLEIFFGGAAGGGKSDTLLMGALQYIDIPGYSAILFRKSYEDLALPGALMDRANMWLSKTDAMKKNGGRRWEFPGGGTLQFGYLAEDGDKFRYQSAEFQYVAFDELSHFSESVYSYMFSRLRRPKIGEFDSLSQKKEKRMLADVPLRMRSASNPGGKHGEWVKQAFITKAYMKASIEEQFGNVWAKEGPCTMCYGIGQVIVNGLDEKCFACKGSRKSRRYFIPAKLEDNPSLDQQSYKFSLSKLDTNERLQLESGRWDIIGEGILFKADWVRRYFWTGEHIRLKKFEGERLGSKEHQWFFLTADTASKEKTVNDPTVICAWAVIEPTLDLCLVGVFRDRILIPEILPAIQMMYKKWKANFVEIEEASSGISLIQEATMTERGKGMVVSAYSPHGRDKIHRAQKAMTMMKAGRVFFPEGDDDTLNNCINELLQFPDGAHDDFVDNLAMACEHVHSLTLDRITVQTERPQQLVGGLQTPLANHYRRSY